MHASSPFADPRISRATRKGCRLPHLIHPRWQSRTVLATRETGPAPSRMIKGDLSGVLVVSELHDRISKFSQTFSQRYRTRRRLPLMQRASLPLKHRLAELRYCPLGVVSERNKLGRGKPCDGGLDLGDRDQGSLKRIGPEKPGGKDRTEVEIEGKVRYINDDPRSAVQLPAQNDAVAPDRFSVGLASHEYQRHPILDRLPVSVILVRLSYIRPKRPGSMPSCH